MPGRMHSSPSGCPSPGRSCAPHGGAVWCSWSRTTSDGSSIAAFHRADMVTIPQAADRIAEGDDPRRIRCSNASGTAPRTHANGARAALDGPRPSPELVPSPPGRSRGHSYRPCPKRALSSGPQRSSTDNHGRCPCRPSCSISPSERAEGASQARGGSTGPEPRFCQRSAQLICTERHDPESPCTADPFGPLLIRANATQANPAGRSRTSHSLKTARSAVRSRPLKRLAHSGDRHGRYPAVHWAARPRHCRPESASLCKVRKSSHDVSCVFPGTRRPLVYFQTVVALPDGQQVASVLRYQSSWVTRRPRANVKLSMKEVWTSAGWC